MDHRSVIFKKKGKETSKANNIERLTETKKEQIMIKVRKKIPEKKKMLIRFGGVKIICEISAPNPKITRANLVNGICLVNWRMMG